MLAGRISLHILLGGAAIVGVGGAALTMLGSYSEFNSSWYSLIFFWLFLFGMLVGVVNILHRKSFRVGGLYLAWAFLATFAISILSLAGWVESSSKFWATFLVLLLFGLPAGGALLVRKKPWGAAFAWTFMSIATLAGAAILYVIWYGENGSSSATRVYYAALVSVTYGLPGSLNLINVGRGDWRLFRWPAVAAMAAAIAMAVYSFMRADESAPAWIADLFYWSRLLATFAGTMGLVNVLLMTKRGGLTAWCKWAAIAAVSALGVMTALGFAIDYLIVLKKLEEKDANWNWIMRGVAASIILTMAAVVCELIARTALRITQVPTSPPEISSVDLTCPHCKSAGTISLKDGACKNCRLKFRITLLEPKCPRCDYLLYHVTSRQCPECGLGL